MNFTTDPFQIPEDKETYSFDDILELKLDNKKYIINKVLGQKFFIVENEYPFVSYHIAFRLSIRHRFLLQFRLWINLKMG